MNHVADNIIHEDGIETKPEYYVKELTNRLRLIWDITKNNIRNSRNVMKKQYDKKVAVRHFRLGDIVLLKQDKIPAQASRKLYRNFSEKQYYITKVLPNCTFILRDLETNKEIKAPVNINRLKRFYDTRDVRQLEHNRVDQTFDITKQNNAQSTPELMRNIVNDDEENKDTEIQKNNTKTPEIPKSKKWYRAKMILRAKQEDINKLYLIKWTKKTLQKLLDTCEREMLVRHSLGMFTLLNRSRNQKE